MPAIDGVLYGGDHSAAPVDDVLDDRSQHATVPRVGSDVTGPYEVREGLFSQVSALQRLVIYAEAATFTPSIA